ncbi:MAG: SDR family oxidoreductase [Bryobacterales bacterium]|nr:SDR family oxidoreductase [Bryobacterales bacterium]
MSPLEGKRIVLAGGAGGIGSAVARLLAAEGARLVVTYRANDERAARVSGLASVMRADLVDSTDRRNLLDAVPDLYGLVILAGDPARLPDFEAALERSYRANFLGPVLLAREAAERMKTSGTPGALVLVGTMQATSLFPGSTAYAAPKASLVHAARILARECRGRSGIRVNVVSPGVTAAGMAEASIAAGKYDRFIGDGTIQRFGRAEDVARAIRFFLEPDNYITGQVLSVDGGLTL